MLGLTAPCRHFFSCRAARASPSRAPTDTACAGASGPSRRRSSSVPPAGARMYREGRGGERSRRGVSCVRRRRAVAVKNGEDSRGATAVAELARNREAVLGVAFSKLTLSSKQNFVLSHTRSLACNLGRFWGLSCRFST